MFLGSVQGWSSKLQPVTSFSQKIRTCRIIVGSKCRRTSSKSSWETTLRLWRYIVLSMRVYTIGAWCRYNGKIALWFFHMLWIIDLCRCLCNRYHFGHWKPELRLHCLWLPACILPIGLDICDAALEYHLHYMGLALEVYLCAFAALAAVPICVNYVAECFPTYATQAALIVGVYRPGWGIAIPFFWQVGWRLLGLCPDLIKWTTISR